MVCSTRLRLQPAQVALVIAGALQLGFGVLALYYVQEALAAPHTSADTRTSTDASATLV